VYSHLITGTFPADAPWVCFTYCSVFNCRHTMALMARYPHADWARAALPFSMGLFDPYIVSLPHSDLLNN